MRSWHGNLSPFGSFHRAGASGLALYAVLGYRPTFVADMVDDAFYLDTARSTFDDLFTHSRLGNATMVDSDGLIKWGPHNLLTNSEDFSNVAWTKSGVTATVGSIVEDTSTGNHRLLNTAGITVSAVSHTQAIEVKPSGRTRVRLTNNNLVGSTYDLTGSGSVVSGSGDIAALDDGWYRISISATSPTTERLVLYLDDGTGLSYTGDGISGVEVRRAHLYRSDLGGMAPVPADARVAGSTTYVPTTSTAKYLPRRHNHVYNGSAWVDAGTLIETEARTQLLHTTNTLVTQSHTVTAVPHTLHFTGTGTVTLSGASTAGPLVGTGTGEENRVSLTFTPTAGILILIVSGTVTDAQLEVGSTPSSYTPNLAASGTVTRAADTSGLTIDSSIVPWPTPKVIGDELVTNGDFGTGDLTGWIDASFGTGTAVYNSGGVDLTRVDVSNEGQIRQSVTTIAGSVYEVSYDRTSGTNGRLWIGTGTTGGDRLNIGEFIPSGTNNTVFFRASSATTYLLFNVGANGVTVRFDNISVKEINPLAVCIQMKGRATGDSYTTLRWYADANNYITQEIGTSDFTFEQAASGTADSVTGGSITSGINQAFNIASRHGSTFINGAVDGTALTADTTPVALPDLSGSDLQIGYDFMDNIEEVRVWVVDIGDTGIAEASS